MLLVKIFLSSLLHFKKKVIGCALINVGISEKDSTYNSQHPISITTYAMKEENMTYNEKENYPSEANLESGTNIGTGKCIKLVKEHARTK